MVGVAVASVRWGPSAKESCFVDCVLYAIFFLAPTGLSALSPVPITFNNRIAAGGALSILMLLFPVFLARARQWHQTALDYPLLFLIILKALAFWTIAEVMVLYDPDLWLAQLKVLVTLLFLYLSYYPLSYFIRSEKRQVARCLFFLGLGAVSNALMAVYTFLSLTIGVEGTAYTFKRIFQKTFKSLTGQYSGTEVADISGNLPHLVTWLKSVEGTITLGPLFACCSVFFIGLSLFCRGGLRWLLLGVSVLQFAATLFMVSRSAILSFSVGFIMVMIAYLFVVVRDHRRLVAWLLVFLLSFLAGISVVLWQGEFLGRMTLEYLSDNPRLPLWANIIKLLVAEPFGIGQMGLGVWRDMGNGFGDIGGGFQYSHAHNAFLQTGVESGWLGMFLLAALLVVPIGAACRGLRAVRSLYHSDRESFPCFWAGVAMACYGFLVSFTISMCYESRFLTDVSIVTELSLLVIVLAMKSGGALQKCVRELEE